MEVKLYFRRQGQSRVDTIEVSYRAFIDEATSNVKNFSIIKIQQNNTFLESKVFHSFTDRKWNFNELEFFCKNNNICLEVSNWNDSTLLRSIGACDTPALRGDYNADFSNDFFNI